MVANIIICVLALVVLVLGIFGNSWLAGLILAALIVLALVLYRTGVITITAARMALLRRYGTNAALVVAAIAIILLAFGVWSPDIKKSYDRWSYDQKRTAAYALDKRSLQTEAEAGVVGKINEDSAIYTVDSQRPIMDPEGKTYLRIKSGTRVKAIGMEGASETERFEGMTKVMLENPAGDFVAGNVVFIPSRKINWGS